MKTNWLKQNCEKIICLILSLMGTMGAGLLLFFDSGNDRYVLNSFVYILVFVAFLCLYVKVWGRLARGEKIFAICFSIFLSVILALGTTLDVFGEIDWSWKTPATISLLSFAIYPVTGAVIELINKVKLKNISDYSKKKLWWITYGIIFIGGILVLLAVFPGVYGYDAAYQMAEVLEDSVEMTVKYPLPFCYLLAGMVNLGKVLFGSYEIGLAMFSLLQLVFMTYVATKMVMYVLEKTRNIYFYAFSVLFFGAFPLYTVMTVSTTQDTIFAGVFSLLFLKLLEVVENKDFWKKKRNPIILAILVLLLCLMRMNGVYCAAVAVILMVIFGKGRRVALGVCFAIPICIYLIYANVILGALGIHGERTIQEMSSIPSQQLARVYTYNFEGLDEGDKEELDKYYAILDNFQYYEVNPSISDLMKAGINEDAVKNDPMGYLGLWAKLGLKDGENYIEAFLMNNLGMWYPNKNYKDTRMYHPYIEYEMTDAKYYHDYYIEIKRTSLFQLYDKVLQLLLVRNAWKAVPVVSTVFTTGSYFILVVFLTGLIIVRRNWKYLIPLCLVAGLYVTVILAPVMLLRYMFGIIVIAPILVALVFEQKRSSVVK